MRAQLRNGWVEARADHLLLAGTRGLRPVVMVARIAVRCPPRVVAVKNRFPARGALEADVFKLAGDRGEDLRLRVRLIAVVLCRGQRAMEKGEGGASEDGEQGGNVNGWMRGVATTFVR